MNSAQQRLSSQSCSISSIARNALVQIILALITLPFAFFGVDYYFRGGREHDVVATVGSQKVTQQRVRRTRCASSGDRMRQRDGRPQLRPGAARQPRGARYAARREQLVNQRLLAGRRRGRQLPRLATRSSRQFIARHPARSRRTASSRPSATSCCSATQEHDAVRSSRTACAARLAQCAVAGAADARATIVASASAARYLDPAGAAPRGRGRRRSTREAVREGRRRSTMRAVKAFYDQNLARVRRRPSRRSIEYASCCRSDALSAKAHRRRGRGMKARTRPTSRPTRRRRERTASHILIAVKPDASRRRRRRPRSRRPRRSPRRRSAARSASPSSRRSEFAGPEARRRKGGDLGSFGTRHDGQSRSRTPRSPRSQATSWVPVQTDFGCHVIQRDRRERRDAVGRSTRSRSRSRPTSKRQRRGRSSGRGADQFQNLVYEQADSLAGRGQERWTSRCKRPASSASRSCSSSGGTARSSPTQCSRRRRLQAKRNSEAIEIAPNTLMAARVVEYKPAAPRSPLTTSRRRSAAARTSARRREAAERAESREARAPAAGQSRTRMPASRSRPIEVARSRVRRGSARRAREDLPDRSDQVPGVRDRDHGARRLRDLPRDQGDRADVGDARQTRLKLASERMADQLGRELAVAYLASLGVARGRQDQPAAAREEAAAVALSQPARASTRGSGAAARQAGASARRSRDRTRSPFSLTVISGWLGSGRYALAARLRRRRRRASRVGARLLRLWHPRHSSAACAARRPCSPSRAPRSGCQAARPGGDLDLQAAGRRLVE